MCLFVLFTFLSVLFVCLFVLFTFLSVLFVCFVYVFNFLLLMFRELTVIEALLEERETKAKWYIK